MSGKTSRESPIENTGWRNINISPAKPLDMARHVVFAVIMRLIQLEVNGSSHFGLGMI